MQLVQLRRCADLAIGFILAAPDRSPILSDSFTISKRFARLEASRFPFAPTHMPSAFRGNEAAVATARLADRRGLPIDIGLTARLPTRHRQPSTKEAS
ncbi:MULTISPECIES: hypothetical protein [Burkholderia]|uniref:Uncharacterized protein n=1 Tax=Burkholderia anthina TaxID=179879 RepID=A0A7T6VH06_9BURK|nr:MULTISPECIES: hypothetical protein [Burkholderia]MBY4871145.1 hypothetical protein [Burkholderia anthina]QQK03718.1 hypothetical protein JFN94_06030 [Burkholderia anthina]